MKDEDKKNVKKVNSNKKASTKKNNAKSTNIKKNVAAEKKGTTSKKAKIESKTDATKEIDVKTETIKDKDIMNKKASKKSKKEKKKERSEKADRNFSFNITEVVFIVLVSISFGIIVGFILTYKRSPILGEKVSDELNEFIQVYDNIRENYYGEVDDKKLIDSAISGMVGSLEDPNSTFIDESISDEFNESITGSYVGIGASIQQADDGIKVVEVFKDSPADKAGLKVDDIVVKVNGEDVTKLDVDSIADLVKGEANTTVKITILRKEKEKTLKITRKKIELESVSSKVFEKNDKKIGYIFIESFPSNVYNQFKKELTALENKKIDSLIIDVRNNPGGQLSQVKKVLDLFFDKKTVLYQIENKGEAKKYYATNNTKRTYPVAVLGDCGSASAAEILISCFKDNYKDATFIGETTYGKGTVQKSIELSTGSSVKYTSQKWLTSKGKWIDGEGIEPDIKVYLNGEYYEPGNENDKQIIKALEILTK